jgi:TolA-binding protein
MKLPGKKKQPAAPTPGAAPGKGPGPRVRNLEDQVAKMRQRIDTLEQEVQESRQLNKRLAEITDVVAEVLLPAEHRDEERLRAVLRDYEAKL